MRLIGRHEDRLTGVRQQRFPRNHNFRFPLQDVRQRIERGRMFAQALALIECEKRYGSRSTGD